MCSGVRAIVVLQLEMCSSKRIEFTPIEIHLLIYQSNQLKVERMRSRVEKTVNIIDSKW